MAIVLSAGDLAIIQSGWYPINTYGSIRFYNRYNYDYSTIYSTQPNVRTCVDFLARNIAQLGLHVFERISDTDRKRIIDHPFSKLLSKPLPAKYKYTRYRIIESLISDLGIFFNAYWLKIRLSDGEIGGLLRIPPQFIQVKGGLIPVEYQINFGGSVRGVDPESILHFKGYNPESPISGLSPLETLRRILAEEFSAGEYRENFWQNAARMKGIIKRPVGAPDWSKEARDRFKSEYEALYTGPQNSARTAILEEGMEWENVEFSAEQAEYLGGRKLTREECARAYHIPPPMVGILEYATFSNITEQHKNLYQDTLGPWLKAVEEEIELQLMGDFEGTENFYVEFNIAEKLAGSFQEQTISLQSAVGRPWMTANEARARMNLPSIRGADSLVIPLNVMVGGLASPRDTGRESGGNRAGFDQISVGNLADLTGSNLPVIKVKGIDIHNENLRKQHEEKWRGVLIRHYRRQESAIMSRISEKSRKDDIAGIWWDEERWNRELIEDLLPLNILTAGEWAKMVLELLGGGEVSEAGMIPWLTEHTRIQAEYINGNVADQIEAGLMSDDPRGAIKDMFGLAVSVWAIEQAITAVTSAMNFGAFESAKSGGMRRKMWQVNSGKPRPMHAAMNGETVGIRERFSNGQKFPGDPAGGAENNSNCLCSVNFLQ